MEIVEWHEVERESRCRHYVGARCKRPTRWMWTLEKAVELGVTRFVPVASRRSVLKLEGERVARRVAHWRAVAISACEQCGRNRLPAIDDVIGLERRSWRSQRGWLPCVADAGTGCG